jgi:hypothetical protein
MCVDEQTVAFPSYQITLKVKKSLDVARTGIRLELNG